MPPESRLNRFTTLPPSPPFYAIWDARLEPHERDLVKAAGSFCDEVITPFADQAVYSRQSIPRSTVRAWAKLGMTAIQTPSILGGLGGSYFAKIRVAQELARRSFACAFSLNNMQSLAWMIAVHASAEVQAKYLKGLLTGELVATIAITEPGGGSDVAASKTTAQKVQGGWLLNGEKAWATNATLADLMVVTAQTASGTAGIGRFVVDMKFSGVERLPAHPVTAGHAIGLGGIRLVEVFVPDQHLLEQPGQGFKAAMEGINGARVHVAAMCVATLEASLGIAIRYCSERHAFGKPLLENQGLRWKLVEVASQLEAANLLVYRASDLIYSKQDATLAASHAKNFASSIAMSGLEICMQSMGAQAMLDPMPLARQLAELKLAGYADGTTEIQQERIGTYLLKHYGA